MSASQRNPVTSRACEPRNPISHADKMLVQVQDREAVPAKCKCLLSASQRNPVTLALASQGTQSLTPTAYQYQHKNAKPFRPRVCACLISAPKEPSHSRACEPRNPVTRADNASESFGRVRRLSQKLQVDAGLTGTACPGRTTPQRALRTRRPRFPGPRKASTPTFSLHFS